MAIGMQVSVSGSVRTNENGERYIEASTVSQYGTGTIEPIFITNQSVGGGDWQYDPGTGAGQQGVRGGYGLNNIGLLVRTCGRVESVDSSTHSFVICDGTHSTVKCIVPSDVSIDPNCTFVTVTGISSCERVINENLQPELHRIIRVRTQGDVVPCQ